MPKGNYRAGPKGKANPMIQKPNANQRLSIGVKKLKSKLGIGKKKK